jgi:hypothetical protein
MIRFRRRDAGISMVLNIILILLAMILAVAAVVLWTDWKQKQRTLDALIVVRGLLTQEEADIKASMIPANEATGLPMGEDGKLAPGKASEEAKKRRQEYFSVEALDRIPLTPSLAGTPQPLKKENVDAFNRAKDGSPTLKTLQDLVEPASARLFHVKNRLEQLQVDLGSAQESTKSRQAIAPEIPRKKEEKKAELQKEIARLNEEVAKENERHNTRKATLTEDKVKAEAETSVEAEKYVASEIKVSNETRELRRQLEELKVKEVIKHEISFIHGKILDPDVPNKIAFISIGSRERVVPGLKFLVGRRGVQGKFEFKGKVEVKKAWMTHCEVSIIEIYDQQRKPIIEGDFIVNPLFSKERPLVVAFVGEDRPLRLRYSVDEASRRIKEIGSDVRKEITLDLDYVIFTETAAQKTRENYDLFKKALFLEIPIADASDIFRFLGD